ncbi:DUF7002 family protein [Parasediminibacterium sp. JCM 36343]|uniref:DUF7002 family protein n=1 Tax=Parasediminibacterium sp. JCM 36343 TaxID=3374279 RepID=UPI00397D5A31
MEQNELLNKVPYIYHLTDKRNLDFIYETKKLYSTNRLIDLSNYSERETLKTNRRIEHISLDINGKRICIRDQRPLNAALDKCLTDGWNRSQFIHLLNSRVFFWPNLKRLNIHFGRYKNECPVIFKIDTSAAIQLNPLVELCHLNSGATRPLGILGGKAPERGANTFVSIGDYSKGISKLAEVTFPSYFNFPDSFFISFSPAGPWETRFL